MIGINDENTDLLDFTQIKEYLSFVAPVPYQNTFLFRAEVYKHIMKVLQLTVHLIKLIVIKRKKLNYKRKEKEEIL